MATTQPSEAFKLLADETRMDIISELGRAAGNMQSGARSYSELMNAIGARDSGRFNYHLNQLLGHFVVRENEKYALSYEGVLIYRSVLAGTFSEKPPHQTLRTESSCHECGGQLIGRLDDHLLFITCDDCGRTFLAGYLPPRSYANRTPIEVLSVLNQRIRFQMGLIGRSVCPWCYGATTARILPADETPFKDRPVEITVRHACSQCHAEGWTTLGQRLLHHPDMIAFHLHHDIVITELPLWEIGFAVTDHYTSVQSHDPYRATLSITLDDDRFSATITEDAHVEAVTWTGRDESEAEPTSKS